MEILVVEDGAAIADFLARGLEAAGYGVVTAADGDEGERLALGGGRSEASRARGSGGRGLGLAIARSIVELHGGRIWVEDSPLGGARVAFELGEFEPQLGTA